MEFCGLFFVVVRKKSTQKNINSLDKLLKGIASLVLVVSLVKFSITSPYGIPFSGCLFIYKKGESRRRRRRREIIT